MCQGETKLKVLIFLKFSCKDDLPDENSSSPSSQNLKDFELIIAY